MLMSISLSDEENSDVLLDFWKDEKLKAIESLANRARINGNRHSLPVMMLGDILYMMYAYICICICIAFY